MLAVAAAGRSAPSGSSTQAMPPLMPAPKLLPVGPSTTTRPPVMYSQPWSPTPSTTARAPELRTAKRSPAQAAEERRPDGGAVEGHVAGDHVALGLEAARRPPGATREDAAREALAGVVVGLAVQRRRSRRARARRRSSGRPSRVELDLDRALGQAVGAVATRRSRSRAAPPTARSTLPTGVWTRTGSPCSIARPRRRSAASGGRASRRASAPGRSRVGRAARRRRSGHREQRPQVDARAFQCSHRRVGLEQLGPADEVLEAATPSAAISRRASSATHEQVVDHVLGRAREARAAARDPAWRSPTGQVFRWQTRIMMQPVAISGAVEKPTSSAPSSAAIDHVAAGAHLAVGLQRDARAQAVVAPAPAGSRPGRAPTARRRPGSSESGEAPVPPSWPAMTMWSALRLGDAGGDRADARTRPPA